MFPGRHWFYPRGIIASRLKRRLAWALGAAALVAAALVALAAALIDTPAVQAEIQRRLSAALGGQVTWESQEIALFPPRAELRQLHVEVPGKVSAAADEMQAALRLWPLLLGQVEISSVSLKKAGIRIAAGDGGSDAQPDALALYRAAVEPAARALREFAPDMAFRLTDAEVDVALAGKPLELRRLNGTLNTKSTGFELKLAAASNFWKQLSAEARVEYADLSARASVALDGLTIDPDLPAATLRATPRTDGSTAIECDFDASLGALASAKGKLALPAGKPPQLAAHLGGIDLAQALALARRKVPGLDAIESAQGKLSAKVDLSLVKAWQARFEITQSDAAVKLAPLPGNVSAHAGVVTIDPQRVRFDKVALSLLDARTLVSGSVLFRNSAIELALADGAAGETLVRWALEQAGAPPRLEPKTPLRFTAQRIAWAPKGALQADARVEFPDGPVVGLALDWRPELLELRRVAIKDARSDAVLTASVAGELIRASFSGTLHNQSIPAMLRQPPAVGSGSARGDLRLTIDRKQPARTAAEGRLRIEALDLSWLAGKKAVIERAELTAERSGMRIAGARFGWEDQFFELSGEGRRTEQGPVVDARIESAGVDVFRLLPPADPNAPRKKSSALWPLPVSGRIELRTAFAQYKEHRVEPFVGVLSLEPKRARLEVKQASMCGVSFPMELEFEPEQASAAAHIRVKDQPLERTVPCLTGGTVELTGNADLVAELRVKGRRPHLVRGLTGTVHTEVRDGRVKKFALLGNILSFRGVSSFNEMKGEGFPYRSMTARGHFENGTFLVEESFFDSDAVRLAAHGRVDLLGADSQLTVLVGLLTRVDRVAGAIPIIGDVFGGSMTALPVGVHGDIRDPLIVPLGPRAVSDQLLGIFERTLKLPGKLVVPPQGTKP